LSVSKPLPARSNEIWWIHIRDALNHEQDGDRPALVLVNHFHSKLIMCIPFTKNLDAGNIPHSHLVQRSVENGLLLDSIALIYQTRAKDIHVFIKKWES